MDVRSQLTLILLACCVVLCNPADARCSSRYLGGNLSEILNDETPARINFSLKTPYGRERFSLSRRNTQEGSSGTSYVGYSAPSLGDQGGLPSSLSIDGAEARLFFISRRTGRPAALTFTVARNRISTSGPLSRVHRFEELPCKHLDHALGEISHSAGKHAAPARALSTAELGIGTAPFSPPRIVDISTYTDPQFSAIHGEHSKTYIQATFDAANSIYMSQMGIFLQLRSIQLAGMASRSSRSYKAEGVLESFRTGLVRPSPRVDLYHLFTGKSFDDPTIGLAYVGSVCEAGAAYSVGLSKSVKPALQPLVFAHEVAHGLGARHDSDPFSIMNPAVSVANTNFSNAAQSAMREHIDSAGACLAPMTVPLVSLALGGTDSIFSAQVSLQTWNASLCSVDLLARPDRSAKKRSKRKLSAHWRMVKSAQIEAQVPGTVYKTELATRLPVSFPKVTSRYVFRSIVTCGTSKASSHPQFFAPSSVATGALSTNTPSDWLTMLISNFSG